MSSELREKLTVEEWLNGFLTMSDMRAKVKAGDFRSEAEKKAIIEEQEAIFEGVDPAKLTSAVIYLVQILRKDNADGTIYLLEMLADVIKAEEAAAQLPPSIRKLLEAIVGN